MRLVRTVAEMRDAMRGPRTRGERVGLVPTMGALHRGHEALLRAARSTSEVVVASLFVNPAQFDDAGDLARYPRDEEADLRVLEEVGVDLVFAPGPDELYPDGFDTWVDPGRLGAVLEGASRPGHFRGVATVCTKLFAIVGPTTAHFGRKDAQQVAIVRQVVADLNLPIEIVAHPTVRDADGLAISSRNALLTPDERSAALALPRALEDGLAASRRGEDAVAAARARLATEPGVSVDYVAEADLDGPTLAAAVRVGSTRLIDNVELTDS